MISPSPKDLQDAWAVIEATIPSLTYFKARPALAYEMRRKIQTMKAELVIEPFAFDGRRSFYTRTGRWQPRAIEPALAMFLTAHCKGGEFPFAAPSLEAAHNAINRQIESLARVNLDLANALAFQRGDAPGLHLRRHHQHRGLFMLRFQAPHGFRLGPPKWEP